MVIFAIRSQGYRLGCSELPHVLVHRQSSVVGQWVEAGFQPQFDLRTEGNSLWRTLLLSLDEATALASSNL